VLTVNTQFEYELRKVVREELDRLKDNLTSRITVSDYSIYSFYVGQIQALERVIDQYVDEVNTRINKRD
jgi:hypothetical protein